MVSASTAKCRIVSMPPERNRAPERIPGGPDRHGRVAALVNLARDRRTSRRAWRLRRAVSYGPPACAPAPIVAGSPSAFIGSPPAFALRGIADGSPRPQLLHPLDVCPRRKAVGAFPGHHGGLIEVERAGELLCGARQLLRRRLDVVGRHGDFFLAVPPATVIFAPRSVGEAVAVRRSRSCADRVDALPQADRR